MTTRPDGPTAADQTAHILIVDDKPADAAETRRIMEGGGFDVVGTLSNGQELLTWLRAHPGKADVVILDIILPVLDGFAAFYEIREMARPPKVIFLSVENSAAIVRKLLEDGAADFIVKPVKEDVLLAQVRKLFQTTPTR